MGVSQTMGYDFGGPNHKDCNICGLPLRFPSFQETMTSASFLGVPLRPVIMEIPSLMLTFFYSHATLSVVQ